MDKLRFKLDGAVKDFIESFIETFSDWECFVAYDEVTEIAHESYSGFIPFTNGGYMVSASDTLSAANSRGLTATEDKHIAGYIESSLNDSAADFIGYRDELTVISEADNYTRQDASALLFEYFDKCETAYDDRYHNADAPEFAGMGKVPAFWSTAEGMIKEDYFEYEAEYLQEGGEFFWQVRAHYYSADNSQSESGADEVYFLCGVNTDFTYGRDKYLQICAHETVKVTDLTPAKLAQLRDWFEAAMIDDTAEDKPLENYSADYRFYPQGAINARGDTRRDEIISAVMRDRLKAINSNGARDMTQGDESEIMRIIEPLTDNEIIAYFNLEDKKL
jgi:hypothetical protein